jgi:4-amino-4-deoxy-L-arabinose transferase-like glycosyltransferase
MFKAGLSAVRLDHLADGWRPWVLLSLLALSLFLPGLFTLPPIDRDEPRYMQATRQMLETGDFVRIRFQDEARNKKPAGVYWLQAAAVAAFSTPQSSAPWPYRLVSVFGAVAAVLLTFAIGAAIFDRRTALIAAGLLASTVDLVFEAHVATTDALMLPTAVAAQGLMGLAYLGARRGERLPIWGAVLFWVAQGLALLIKGPVVPLLSLLTAISLVLVDRRAAWLKALHPAWGVPLALAIVLPWLVWIEIDTGGAFIQDSIGRDLLGKVAAGQEAHGSPPGTYLALLPVTFWPASLFLGIAGLWMWRARRLPASRLLAAWVIPYWILLELVPTKLPHYVLPLYPALALAAARACIALNEEGMVQPSGWIRWLFPGLWAAAGMALGVVVLILPVHFGLYAMPAGAIAVAASLAVAWQCLRRDRAYLGTGSAIMAVIASLCVLTPGFGIVLPRLDPIWLSRSAASLINDHRETHDRVAISGYSEPSIVFLLGTDTDLATPDRAAADLLAGKVGLALIADSDDAAFRNVVTGQGERLDSIGSVSGFDYSNGKTLTLRAYRLTQHGS